MPRRLLSIVLLLALIATSGARLSQAAPSNDTVVSPLLRLQVAYCASEEESALLTLVNAHRQVNGLQPLTLSISLGAAARHHAESMAAYDYFDYTLVPEGIDFSQNIANFGYAGSYLGANIAAGPTSVDAATVFNQWLVTPSQRENLVNPGFTAIGIGSAVNPEAAFVNYWSATFGEVADGEPASACAPSATPVAQTATLTSSPTTTAEPTETATTEPTETATIEPTETAITEPTETATIEPTETATTAPKESATAEPTQTATVEPTETATEEPTATERPEPTATAEPSATSTTEPTEEPTETPSAEPTATATSEPTAEPTETSTVEPSPTSTAEPTETATSEPSATPTLTFTTTPSPEPTETPEPTATPTLEPTETSTSSPSPTATATATTEPTATATATTGPTVTATSEPTSTATTEPSATSSPSPTSTLEPSATPTSEPTSTPTNSPASPVVDASATATAASPTPKGSDVSDEPTEATATATPTGPFCDADRDGAKAAQEVVVTCANFPADEEVVLYWDDPRESAEIERFSTDEDGNGEVTFLAPETPSGRYLLIARSIESRVTDTVPFVIRPGLFVVPKSGDAGDVVSADLTGFQPGEAVTVTWYDDEDSTRVLRMVTVGEDGSTTLTFRAPRADAGTYTIEASGITGTRATVTFEIEAN